MLTNTIAQKNAKPVKISHFFMTVRGATFVETHSRASLQSSIKKEKTTQAHRTPDF
jgi:hypothetical protein